jgi:hypothetical protein
MIFSAEGNQGSRDGVIGRTVCASGHQEIHPGIFIGPGAVRIREQPY